MVKAVQIDSNGNVIGGTERWFPDAHWAHLESSYGKTLRWRKVEEKPLKKQKQTKITTEDEKTDFSYDDGGVSTAVDG